MLPIGAHGGTLQCLDHELGVVHIDLVGHPTAIGISTNGHVCANIGRTDHIDGLVHNLAVQLHIEHHGPRFSDLAVRRARYEIQ